LHLKTKFIINTGIIIASVIILGVVSFDIFDSLLSSQIPLLEKSQSALTNVLNMRIHEKIFLNTLPDHLDFFQGGTHSNLDAFDKNYQLALKDMDTLKSINTKIETENLSFLTLDTQLTKYHDSFKNVSEMLKKRGIWDYGIEGEFRVVIHQLENTLHEKNDLELENTMLEIRVLKKIFSLEKIQNF